jgi:hypothetical protein
MNLLGKIIKTIIIGLLLAPWFLIVVSLVYHLGKFIEKLWS